LLSCPSRVACLAPEEFQAAARIPERTPDFRSTPSF